jgi:hypothetical protein
VGSVPELVQWDWFQLELCYMVSWIPLEVNFLRLTLKAKSYDHKLPSSSPCASMIAPVPLEFFESHGVLIAALLVSCNHGRDTVPVYPLSC